jgi:hypothetical protein
MSTSNTWLGGISVPRPMPEWADRSMMAFAEPHDGHGLPSSVTVSRDERRGAADPVGESFDAYVQRQRQVLETSLPGFQARRPTPLGAGSAEAQDALFSWRSGAFSLTQWVVWRTMPDATVMTFTATSESSRFDDQRTLFEDTLRRILIDAAAFAGPVA